MYISQINLTKDFNLALQVFVQPLRLLCLVQATVCMVCKSFKRGHCLVGKSNCTIQSSPGCRSRNFVIFSQTSRWIYSHNELDCSEAYFAENMYFGNLKVSIFCCKGEDFCNRYHGPRHK
uniref:Uncharacterized protein n=1 Tax=Peromyscus maniculatus bairdii TaxID=230844 RepID=A0A8C8UL34_PERMB